MAYKYTNHPTLRRFISPYGHDLYGNGTDKSPYATLNRAAADFTGSNADETIVILPGTYYNIDYSSGNRANVIAESHAYFICTQVDLDFTVTKTNSRTVENITFKGYRDLTPNSPDQWRNCQAFNCGDLNRSGTYFTLLKNTFIRGASSFNNVTEHLESINQSIAISIVNSIVIAVTINFLDITAYNVVNSCFVGSIDVNSTPVDFTGATTSEQRVDRIRTALVNEYGGVASDYLEGCLHYNDISDCKFNDPDNNDYTLQADSPLAYASDTSSYIGAYDVAIKLFADVDGADAANLPSANFEGSFIASTAINLDFNQSSANRSEHYFTPTDPAQDFSIESKPLDFTRVRELGKVLMQGADASRNGLTTTASNALSNSVITPVFNGSEYQYTGIEVDKIYRVEGSSFTYNGNEYLGGSYIIGITGVTTATTVNSNGRLRPSLFTTDIRPNRQTVLLRTSRDGQIFTSADAISTNYWYKVEDDSITYNGNTIVPGKFLLTNGVDTSFTGTGKLIALYPDNEPYRPFNWGNNVNVNTDDSTINGVIEESTGSDDYDFTNEVTHIGRFGQIKVVGNANSIPASIV